MADLTEIVKEVAEHERNARERLKKERRLQMADLTARAEGLLKAARLMTAHEALERLSELRLGIALGLKRRIPMATVDRLLLEVQPAHQAWAGRALDGAARDKVRADRLRAELGGRRTKRMAKRTTT